MIFHNTFISFGFLGANSVTWPVVGMVIVGASVCLGGRYGVNKFLVSKYSWSSWVDSGVGASRFLGFFIGPFPLVSRGNWGSCALRFSEDQDGTWP